MEIAKYRRDEYEYFKCAYNQTGYTVYPKKVAVTAGSSQAVWLDKDTLFKRKQQDGNHSINWEDEIGMHHFIYQEEKGSFDDLAEVICYKLAKRLGTRQKVCNNGEVKTVPLVDCAEYRLAVYTDSKGYVQHGCTSKNIAKDGEVLMVGATLLSHLPEEEKVVYGRTTNTLGNHLKAVERHVNSMNTLSSVKTELDKDIPLELKIRSAFCWKTSNSDNHSNNILYIQKVMPDGLRVLEVATMIDNGAAWEMCGPLYPRYQGLVDGDSHHGQTKIDENGNLVMLTDPFKHTAFALDAGNLNGHTKTFNGEQLDYEYDMVANALADPEFYQALYQMEQNFDIQGVFEEITQEYRLKWPELSKEVITATCDYKSQILANVMTDYFCYSAYKQCVGPVDLENPTELYETFRQGMKDLPLQESIEGYQQAFAEIATKNNIAIPQESLTSVTFLPQNDPVQTDDVAQ